MIVHKIIKYLVLLLALVTAGYFIYTISMGDDVIETSGDAQGSTVVPLMYLAYIMLALIILAVLVFVFVGLFSSAAVLKKSLISVGLLIGIVLLAYFGFADGSDAANNAIELDDGEFLTVDNSKLIGAALYTFYIMAILAVLSIVWSGVTKLIKK
ncbi:MAG: hypothetical protein WBA16_08890 [Nonlabens sp.]